MKSRLRMSSFLAIVVITAGAVSACGTTPGPKQKVEAKPTTGNLPLGLEVGDSASTTIGRYSKVLAYMNGWSIWETANPDRVVCVAVRPGRGHRAPVPDEGTGIVNGAGGGFYMGLEAKGTEDEAIFGFYGVQPYPKIMKAEVDGQVYEGPPTRAVIDGWEGKTGRYEVRSGPYPVQYIKLKDDEGVVELAGIGDAWKALMDCAANAPEPPRAAPPAS